MPKQLKISDQMEALESALTASFVFVDALMDKADYFSKQCNETYAKLYQAQQHYKELKKLLEEK